MKIGVLGAGLMGKEGARDLVASPRVAQVGIADVDSRKARQVGEQLASPKLAYYQVDANNEQELIDFMEKFDVIINGLLYTFNEKVARGAIKAQVHVVDLGGHIGGMTDKVLELHDEAQAAGVTIIPDLGVAPGMINILSGYGSQKLDQLETLKLYVGGIPLRPEPPLAYNHVFSLEGVLDHYTDPSLVIREGQKEILPSLSEVETIYFEKFGPLEAFHTSGGTSTLSWSYPQLKTLEYKTIRYPGHAQMFQLFVDLNLTRKDYLVEIDGAMINPREVFIKVLTPLLELKDKDDVVLLRVQVGGIAQNEARVYEYEMVTHNDEENKVTAMAKTTAYTVSVVAQMIGDGIINKRGVYPPELIVPGDKYIEEMAKLGVNIVERIC